MKATINGFVQINDAEPVDVKQRMGPAWIDKYKFFTNAARSAFTLKKLKKKFVLTEASTGWAVGKPQATREGAIVQGLKQIIDAGEEKFSQLVLSKQKIPK